MREQVGRRHRVRVAGGVALAVLALGVIGGCSGVQDKGSSVRKFDTAGGSADSAASLTSGAGSSGGRAAPKGPSAGAQVAEDRDVIYNGSLTVRVGDAPKAADKARAVADDAGGYLADSDADLEGTKEVHVTLRVPADGFDQAMDDLAKLGSVQARKIGSDDVTDQVVDLKGRLKNAEASAERLRELLAKAENLQNVITIEDRLTQRETEIESLTGQLEVVQDQVKLATIRVTLTEKDEAAVNKDLPGPLEALRSGGVAFVNVVLAVVVALAFALPFLLTAGLALWLFRRWRKAHPKAKASPPPPIWGQAPPPPVQPAPAAPAAASAPVAGAGEPAGDE